ncbi:hypothetical protein E2562_027489 [Oryza meyeriana var. granulata]|uniref:Uncharacterized protein n=1 Tax=Oryza meyeriana var. granulata TaxID=110450 RepID=A0A6G1E2B9_9ORYZ|nr:hypothetical protein E2562_027489 [Oryza meyeriana var. granulata]
MFGAVVGGLAAFSAAPALGRQQQQVECGGELGGFCDSEAGGSSEPEPALASPRGGSDSKRRRKGWRPGGRPWGLGGRGCRPRHGHLGGRPPGRDSREETRE